MNEILHFPSQKPLLMASVSLTADDIQHAVTAWEKNPPDPYFTYILEATPEDSDSDAIPQFGWDKATQRYRDKSSGKFISEARVRELTEKKIDQAISDMSTIANLLVEGKISVATWEQGTRDAIKQLFIQQYLLGIGGLKQMTQRDYGILGHMIQSQYAYLNNFAKDLISKGMSVSQFEQRLQLYANSSRGALERAKLEAHKRAGFLWEKRVRTKTESCNPCISYEARKWVPIGTLPQPTQECDCRANCGCYKEFSNSTDKPSDSLLSSGWGWLG